jgi:hypothetical protein
MAVETIPESVVGSNNICDVRRCEGRYNHLEFNQNGKSAVDLQS